MLLPASGTQSKVAAQDARGLMTNRIELRITERVPFADNHAFGDVGRL